MFEKELIRERGQGGNISGLRKKQWKGPENWWKLVYLKTVEKRLLYQRMRRMENLDHAGLGLMLRRIVRCWKDLNSLAYRPLDALLAVVKLNNWRKRWWQFCLVTGYLCILKIIEDPKVLLFMWVISINSYYAQNYNWEKKLNINLLIYLK